MSISKIGQVTGYGQIASGKRINKASDDAAGMAIANKLKANAKAVNAASRNTREGIDVTRITDGAYSSIHDRLQNIRELSIKAMNGTNSASDLQIIQDEINQNMAGIQDVAQGTNYNTKKLLDGSLATMELATNPTGKGSSIKLEDATLEALGIAGLDVTSGNVDLDAIDKAIEKVSKDRSSLGASANGLEARDRVNQVAYENMTAAQSRIEDLDMGKAVTKLRNDETMQSVRLAMFNKQKQQEEYVTRLFQ